MNHYQKNFQKLCAQRDLLCTLQQVFFFFLKKKKKKIGDNFAKKIEEYLIYWLRKGTPSLFSNIKSLYLNPEKLATIEKIVLGFYETLKSQTKLRSEDEKLEEPTSMLWLLYYLAQLYDFKREHEKALKFINEAIEHTPTVVEVVQGRAKIFKVFIFLFFIYLFSFS